MGKYDIPLRDKKKRIIRHLNHSIISSGVNMTILELAKKYISQKADVSLDKNNIPYGCIEKSISNIYV